MHVDSPKEYAQYHVPVLSRGATGQAEITERRELAAEIARGLEKQKKGIAAKRHRSRKGFREMRDQGSRNS